METESQAHRVKKSYVINNHAIITKYIEDKNLHSANNGKEVIQKGHLNWV